MATSSSGLRFIESIGVKSLVSHDMVLEECLEVLLAVLGKEEPVDAGTEFLECEVGGREEGSTFVGRSLDGFEETGFLEAELQG